MDPRIIIVVAVVVLVGWVGEVVHNAFEFPGMTLDSPENSIPGMLSLILFIAWWASPRKRSVLVLLMIWAMINLIGGAIISVLPLDFLPFEPEQSPRHYLSHVIYGIAQLPLIGVLIWQLRQGEEIDKRYLD